MSRKVQLLEWATRAERPQGMPQGRPRGAKAEGLRYERACAKAIPQAKAGVWWEFRDANGPGWCQTDLVLVGREATLVIECKYTWTESAWDQLERLYVPVLTLALGRPAYGVQMCKMLRPEAQVVVWGLREALESARGGQRCALHWAGIGPLGPTGGGASPGAGIPLAPARHAH